jgi:acetyl esterase/lipase
MVTAKPRRALTAIVVVTVLLATLGMAVTRALPADAPTRVERGVVWRVVDGEQLRLDAFTPAGSSTLPRPAVLLLHGGGWAGGTRAEMQGTGRRLAAAGYAAFSIDYRLAPEHPYPASLDDARAAVEWLRDPAQVARYHLDPSRIGAIGSSAGGQLVGLLATTGDGPLDSGARIRAAVSWSGPMLFWPLDRLVGGPLPRNTVGWWLDSVTTYLGCDTVAACTDLAAEASPVNHVDAGDTPMFLANSDDEIVPTTEATTMSDALARSGVAHRLELVPGRGHASSLGRDVWSGTLAFLDAQLVG